MSDIDDIKNRVENVFGEVETPEHDSTPVSNQFDPNGRINMTADSAFKDFRTPPTLVFRGKVKDGSTFGLPFFVINETNPDGKSHLGIYLKLGYGWKTSGKKYIANGELRYEHDFMDKIKRHSWFLYDQGSFVNFSLAEPLEKDPNKGDN